MDRIVEVEYLLIEKMFYLEERCGWTYLPVLGGGFFFLSFPGLVVC